MNPTFRVAIATAALLGAAGCAADESPLLALNVLAFSGDCSPESGDDAFDSRGALNVAFATEYERYIMLRAQTDAVLRPAGDPGAVARAENANDIIVTQTEITYSGDVALPNGNYPVYFVVSGGGGESMPLVSFFPAEASTALETAIAPGETKTAIASIRFVGAYRSGGSVTSNEVTYPITLTNEACATGTVPIGGDGCGAPGSDTNPVFCGSAATDGGTTTDGGA